MGDQSVIEILLKFGLDDAAAKKAISQIEAVKAAQKSAQADEQKQKKESAEANKKYNSDLIEAIKKQERAQAVESKKQEKEQKEAAAAKNQKEKADLKAKQDLEKKNRNEEVERQKKLNEFTSATTGALKTAAGYLLGFATVSGAIGAAQGAVNNYISKAGTSEPVSKEWIQTTEKLDFAYNRIGKTLATAALPYLEKFADIVEKISKMKLPEAKTPGEVKEGYENGKSEFFDLIFGPGASKDVGLITELYDSNLKTDPALRSSFITNANKALGTTTAHGPAGGTGGTGITSLGKSASSSKTDDYFTVEQLLQYRSYLRGEMEAKQANDIQLKRMDRDFKRTEKLALEDYNKQKDRSRIAYDRQVRLSEEDFYRQRGLANRDFNIQMARTDADYQKSRSRANEDHEFDLYQIALSGDAMSYWLSQRQFKLNQKREEEDFELSKKRSNDDFDKSQNDQEREFEIQRKRAKEEFEIQEKYAKEDFDIAQERRKFQYDQQLEDMAFNFKEQARIRRDAFEESTKAQITNDEEKKALIATFHQFELDSYKQLLSDAKNYKELMAPGAGGVTSPSDGSGADDPTASRRGGDQSDGAASMARSNQMRTDMLVKSMTYNDNRRIDTAVSAEDKAALRQDAQEAMLYAMGG
jgi:hypothetical protein